MTDLLQRFASRHPRPIASRRTVLRGLGLAAGLGATPAARALSPAAAPPPGMVPEREGAMSWDLLADAIGDDGALRLPPALAALEGMPVEVDGWMMVFDDQPRQTEFLLMRFSSHCPFCVPGGAASLVAVRSPAGVAAVEDHPVSVAGTLRIDRRSGGRLVYWLDGARAR